jgi:hypothetical protein
MHVITDNGLRFRRANDTDALVNPVPGSSSMGTSQSQQRDSRFSHTIPSCSRNHTQSAIERVYYRAPDAPLGEVFDFPSRTALMRDFLLVSWLLARWHYRYSFQELLQGLQG